MTTLQPDLSSANRSMGRLGPWLAGLWLFFLLEPLVDAWNHRYEIRGVLGMAVTLAFAAVYLSLWLRTRADRRRLIEHPPLPAAIGHVAALAGLGVAMVALVGRPGLACSVYLSVAAVLVFDLRLAAALVAVIVALVLLLGAYFGWGSQIGTVFGAVAASMAVFGLRAVMARNIELLLAHQENARLAVENERSRFARDLHDILGHSLTVITVKAQLASRLVEVDPGRARAELADLERLSRDALHDVRRTVEGYRELTLPGELARARTALATAEIAAHLPNSADDVPSHLRELFAWTIREGVTNVLRHSGASCCEVRLTSTSAEVRDDGRGVPGDQRPGSGLAGLRERAAAVGAIVVTRQLEPGFSLQVARR